MTGVRVSNRRIYGFRPSGFGVYSGPVYSIAMMIVTKSAGYVSWLTEGVKHGL